MIINDFDAFPKDLRDRLHGVDGAAHYAAGSGAVRFAIIQDIKTLMSPSVDTKAFFRWETAAIIAQEILSRMSARPAFESSALNKAFAETSTTLPGYREMRAILVSAFEGIAAFNDLDPHVTTIINRLRDRYDPARLDAQGRAYDGLKSDWEPPKDAVPGRAAPILAG